MSLILSHCARSNTHAFFIRYVNAHLNIRWMYTWSTWLQTVLLFFHFPSTCVLMSISFWPTWQLAVISRACQPITHLQLFTREDTLKKCRLSMSLRMLPSGCNYLKWVLSQHLTNNFECLHKVHFSKSFFLRKILAILPICDTDVHIRVCDNEKKSVR